MNLFIYRLIYLFCISICWLPCSAVAQTIFEGQALNKTTEAPIPFATVTLSKARIATRTNDQGYFNLNTTLSADNDSLIFTCVGYQTYRMPVSAYKRGMFVMMQLSSTKLREVVIGAKKRTKILDRFTRNELDTLRENINWTYPEQLFEARMFAKPFEAPASAAVTRVDLGRCELQPNWWEPQPAKSSVFKIHVITADPENGAPDSILYTKEIRMADRSRKVSIKLDSSVVIGGKKFFIAIEWLRISYNEYILRRSWIRGLGDSDIENRGFDRVVYQPMLARYKYGGNVKAWRLVNGTWSLFEQRQFKIALSATVNY